MAWFGILLTSVLVTQTPGQPGTRFGEPPASVAPLELGRDHARENKPPPAGVLITPPEQESVIRRPAEEQAVTQETDQLPMNESDSLDRKQPTFQRDVVPQATHPERTQPMPEARGQGWNQSVDRDPQPDIWPAEPGKFEGTFSVVPAITSPTEVAPTEIPREPARVDQDQDSRRPDTQEPAVRPDVIPQEPGQPPDRRFETFDLPSPAPQLTAPPPAPGGTRGVPPGGYGANGVMQ